MDYVGEHRREVFNRRAQKRKEGGLWTAYSRGQAERGCAMAVVVGGGHWQSRAKRAAASAAAPCPASAERALLPLCG